MDPVQGYAFDSVAEKGELAERNGNIVKIVRRAVADDDLNAQDVMDFGPAFVVEFGDGYTVIAHSSELSPWYPT